jgi:glycosyltransferase involved in cell wall biosynthesis
MHDQVRALRSEGHHVLVISGRPQSSESDQTAVIDIGIIEVPVSRWGKLDASAPHDEYAAKGSTDLVIKAIKEFNPEVALQVDWSALSLFLQLKQGGLNVPMAYLNYRVFSRTATGEDLSLVSSLEKQSMATAALTVVLSRSDLAFLRDELSGSGKVDVLLPALREDVRVLPQPADFSDRTLLGVELFISSRPYFTCCVRLSPEKSPEVFVELIEALGEEGVAELGVTPLLIGAAQDEWALRLKNRLRNAVKSSVIIESFLGPADLAQIYSKTRLNFHPPTYDAYGMTIIEAASQGAPSVAHDRSGAIGASDLLLAGEGEIILIDLSEPNSGQCSTKTADQVRKVLGDHARLHQVAEKAMLKSRSYDEAANAKELTRMILSYGM